MTNNIKFIKKNCISKNTLLSRQTLTLVTYYRVNIYTYYALSVRTIFFPKNLGLVSRT